MIDDSFVKLTIRPESMRQLSPDEIAVFEAQEKASNTANDPNAYSGPADNDPENLWGEVVIGGETVAQIFKSGLVVSKQGFELPYDAYAQSAEERASQFLNSSEVPSSLARHRRHIIFNAHYAYCADLVLPPISPRAGPS